MKIVAFGASNSKNSINKTLAHYAASLFQNSETELLDLNNYQVPTYNIDIELENGIPENCKAFNDKLLAADLIIISFASHNGSYTAAYKSIFDWATRINQKVFDGKSLLFLSTSPGPGAAKNVAEMAVASAPYFGGIVKGTFSLPEFHKNFDIAISDFSNLELKNELKNIVSQINLI